MKLVAIRGATCAKNTKDSIQAQTVELMSKIFSQNNLEMKDIVSIQFSLTKDLNVYNPAAALRHGLKDYDVSAVPLFCTQEAYIKGYLKKVIRVLITTYSETEPSHVYINGAERLRPDLAGK